MGLGSSKTKKLKVLIETVYYTYINIKRTDVFQYSFPIYARSIFLHQLDFKFFIKNLYFLYFLPLVCIPTAKYKHNTRKVKSVLLWRDYFQHSVQKLDFLMYKQLISW